MRSYLCALTCAAATAFGSTASFAADIKPALLYDLGGKYDHSFNESAFNGAEKFKKEKGISFSEFEPSNDAQREQALRTFAQRGADPIVTVGFTWALALKKIAPQYPKTRFVTIDNTVDLPNVKSIEFRYNELAFLVGALAGIKTKTGTVGFVGGMDIPLIRDYECGYETGARHTNPKVTVLQNMTGTTPSAWTDPARGRELALGQFDRGADIIFGAAGGTTMGILQAAADANKLAIGVDSNQNGIHPGHVLTSAMSATDVAVYTALSEAADGTWKAGATSLGVKEGGVNWVIDENNRPLLTDDDIAKVDAVKNDIVSGKVKVPEYAQTNSCPAR
ncbi:BMP family ABC transporter substrate-binding protein [Mesorhizobium sp. B2-4-19]|uniref:BMP family lipoprotein n=1 Tax=Mesorhizobium sp. B2-4-19 TaxID=2589930 RepID=UPI001126F0D0|nr:BMP family ABC transporter substrate-binding protein [Mesorhizobium sp. B2-4-19]TPK59251.1 BMP family ABC transporter substrate-binding protein [Mesorhizobium sp. B2-4-19]